MNDFTASNGLNMSRLNNDGLRVAIPPDGYEGWQKLNLHASTVVALREFFQAEADERFGRWRWPENPDYVVYDLGRDPDGFRYAEATHEPTRVGGRWQEGQRSTPPQTQPDRLGIDAVAAYFDAHPEPKPWHDAQPGEVWVFTLDNAPLTAAFTSRRDGEWVGAVTGLPVSLHGVTAARRIWPEVPK